MNFNFFLQTLYFDHPMQEHEIGTTRYLQREETKIAASYLIQCNAREEAENLAKRIEKHGRIVRELENRLTIKKINSIRRSYEKTSTKRITREFMRQINFIRQAKMKQTDLVENEEIQRRYSLLTHENVKKCVQLSFDTLNGLNANYSTATAIHEASLFILRLVVSVSVAVEYSFVFANFVV